MFQIKGRCREDQIWIWIFRTLRKSFIKLKIQTGCYLITNLFKFKTALFLKFVQQYIINDKATYK